MTLTSYKYIYYLEEWLIERPKNKQRKSVGIPPTIVAPTIVIVVIGYFSVIVTCNCNEFKITNSVIPRKLSTRINPTSDLPLYNRSS